MIIGKADCGLQYAVKRRVSSVAYCALSIKCGTRDEDGYHGGIAHFVEHTIFKGTSKRSATVVNSYLDRLGGDRDPALAAPAAPPGWSMLSSQIIPSFAATLQMGKWRFRKVM